MGIVFYTKYNKTLTEESRRSEISFAPAEKKNHRDFRELVVLLKGNTRSAAQARAGLEEAEDVQLFTHYDRMPSSKNKGGCTGRQLDPEIDPSQPQKPMRRSFRISSSHQTATATRPSQSLLEQSNCNHHAKDAYEAKTDPEAFKKSTHAQYGNAEKSRRSHKRTGRCHQEGNTHTPSPTIESLERDQLATTSGITLDILGKDYRKSQATAMCDNFLRKDTAKQQPVRRVPSGQGCTNRFGDEIKAIISTTNWSVLDQTAWRP